MSVNLWRLQQLTRDAGPRRVASQVPHRGILPLGLPLYPSWETTLSAASRNPRYEAHENPPLQASLGFAAQFSVVASVTLLVTPVVVAKASGRDDSYLVWMVFASLLVAGVSTLVQVRRVGPVGAGALLPMFTAAFSIPFCSHARSPSRHRRPVPDPRARSLERRGCGKHTLFVIPATNNLKADGQTVR